MKSLVFLLCFSLPSFAKISNQELKVMQGRVDAVNTLFSHLKTPKGLFEFLSHADPKNHIYKLGVKHAPFGPLPKWSLSPVNGEVRIEGLPHGIKFKRGFLSYNGKEMSLVAKTLPQIMVEIAPIMFDEESATQSSIGFFSRAYAQSRDEKPDFKWYKRFEKNGAGNYKSFKEAAYATDEGEYLARQGNHMLGQLVGIFTGAAIAGSGALVVAATGASGVGAIAGGALVVAGTGVILFNTMSSADASEMSLKSSECIEPKGSFRMRAESQGESMDAVVSVDSLGRPQVLTMSKGNTKIKCSVRENIKKVEGWIWDSEERKWAAQKCEGANLTQFADMEPLRKVSEFCRSLPSEVINTALEASLGSNKSDVSSSPSGGKGNR